MASLDDLFCNHYGGKPADFYYMIDTKGVKSYYSKITHKKIPKNNIKKEWLPLVEHLNDTSTTAHLIKTRDDLLEKKRKLEQRIDLINKQIQEKNGHNMTSEQANETLKKQRKEELHAEFNREKQRMFDDLLNRQRMFDDLLNRFYQRQQQQQHQNDLMIKHFTTTKQNHRRPEQTF